MPPHSRKTAEGPPIEMSEYDETRATARLPNLDIEILHRRPWEGNEERLMVTLRAVPSFEALGHHPCPVSIRALTAEQTLKGAGSASTMIEGLSAITLATHDMCRAVRFYQALGFEFLFGGEAAAFTSFRVGTSYLNLIAQPAERQWSWWGRVIFYVGDVASIGPSGLLRC